MPEPAAAPDLTAIQHSFADINGVRLHYAHAGSGKLLLFLHGFPEFWYAWRNQLAEFGRDFMAVAPDMRGYNLSSKPAEVEKYDIRLLTGDVVGLVRHLGAKACCLVGHDWGGAVAWAVAIAAPQVVEKLVIVNAPHPAVFDRELRENPEQQQASQYMLWFQNPQVEEIISANNFHQFQEGILGALLRQGIFSEADRQAYLNAWSQPGALTGGLNYYRAGKIGPPGASPARSFLSRGELPSLEVSVPTLVIWGEKDPYLLTGNLNGLEHYVRHLKIERVPDATHWVVHEKPRLVNSLIRSFITA
jgi:epoxide hydrolase 4